MKKTSTKGITKQDLAAQRAALKEAQKAVTAQTKAFRHDVAQLKKKGLLDKAYDARSVSPTKYLKSQIKRFGDVLRGEAQPVKVSRSKIKEYGAQGYKTKSGRVIVPVAKNEKAYSTHGDFRVKTTTETGSITRINTGLNANNIHLWESELRKRKIRLKDNERLSFQLFGHNAYQSFLNFEDMIMRLHTYPSYERVYVGDDADKQEQYIENIVIFKFEKGARMSEPQEAQDMREARLAKQASIRREYVERMTPERRNKYKKNRAESESERREKKKKVMTPEQIEAQKAAARARARKSYQQRAGDGKKKDSGN